MKNNPDNVIAIYGADLPPGQVLREAEKKNFSGVVVVGWLEEPEDGSNFYVASSYDAPPKIIYALQHANLLVLEGTRS